MFGIYSLVVKDYNVYTILSIVIVYNFMSSFITNKDKFIQNNVTQLPGITRLLSYHVISIIFVHRNFENDEQISKNSLACACGVVLR